MSFKLLCANEHITIVGTCKLHVYQFDKPLEFAHHGERYKLAALTFSNLKDFNKFVKIWEEIINKNANCLQNYFPFILVCITGGIVVSILNEQNEYLHTVGGSYNQTSTNVDVNIDFSKDAIGTYVVSNVLLGLLDGLKLTHPQLEEELLNEKNNDTLKLVMRYIHGRSENKRYSVYNLKTKERKIKEYSKLNQQGFNKLKQEFFSK